MSKFIKRGDWVVLDRDNLSGRIIKRDPAEDLRNGDCGMVIDFVRGGPEYPPCYLVAWWLDHQREPGRKIYRIGKEKPENLKPYKVGK